jgi:hypothetical protein
LPERRARLVRGAAEAGLQRALGGAGQLGAGLFDPARGGGAVDAVQGAYLIDAEVADAMLAEDEAVVRDREHTRACSTSSIARAFRADRPRYQRASRVISAPSPHLGDA